MKLEPVNPRKKIRIGDADARVGGKVKGEEALERAAAKEVERISELQRVLYADGRHALLIVLQARDAGGKDGTIRKVFTAVNPQGCTVTSFGAPTEWEKRHDFLWRVHQATPALGMIGIFNRSHYEDVLVPHVHGELAGKQLRQRYDHINAFEKLLSQSGVTILKFFLHISRDEQKQRLMDRLQDKTKNWKFRAGDLDDRARWSEFTRAYRGILAETSTPHAPWFIVPADDKDLRNWLIARTIADTLDSLGLRYPRADAAVADIEIE